MLLEAQRYFRLSGNALNVPAIQLTPVAKALGRIKSGNWRMSGRRFAALAADESSSTRGPKPEAFVVIYAPRQRLKNSEVEVILCAVPSDNASPSSVEP